MKRKHFQCKTCRKEACDYSDMFASGELGSSVCALHQPVTWEEFATLRECSLRLLRYYDAKILSVVPDGACMCGSHDSKDCDGHTFVDINEYHVHRTVQELLKLAKLEEGATPEPVCRVCGKAAYDLASGLYLRRTNEFGIPGIWECSSGPCTDPTMPKDREELQKLLNEAYRRGNQAAHEAHEFVKNLRIQGRA